MRTPRHRSSIIGLAVMLCTAAILVGAGAALAATSTGGATFSAVTPADGAVVGAVRPVISVTAYDAVGIQGSPYYSMKVDGGAQTPSFSRINASTVILSLTPRVDLAQGQHTVYVSVRNTAGAWSTYTWKFNVDAKPTLDSPSPAPGSTVATDKPTISAHAGGAVAGLTTKVLLNGVQVASTYDAGTGIITAVPPVKLANGVSNEVTVTVTNSSTLSATLHWTFTANIYPPMPVDSGACTACHTTFPDAHPMDNCPACHGPGSPVGEGWNVPEYSAHSSSYVARTPNSCVDCHTSGYATVPPLHSLAPEAPFHNSTTACTPCHVESLTTEHYRYGKTCATCHASTDSNVILAIASGNTACDACHKNANHESLHVLDQQYSCNGCHPGTSLTGIHITDHGLTCDSCHKSADPLVVSAIANHRKDCTACHDPSHPLDAAFCYGCHTPALRTYPGKAVAQTTDHLTATSSSLAAVVYPGSGAPAASCYNCHGEHIGGSPRAAGNTLCYACHDAAGLPAKPATYSYQGQAAYQATGHQTTPGSCETCHAVHGTLDAQGNPVPAYLTSSEPSLCTGGTGGCHSVATNSAAGIDIAARFSNPAATTHHSLTAADQAVSGARMACTNCHDPHTNNADKRFSAPEAIGTAIQMGTADYIDSSGNLYALVGAQHDGIPPVITNIALATPNGATAPVITWTTNEPASTWVDWGTTTAYEIGSYGADDPKGTAHTVTVPNVSPANPTYHYRVRSTDAAGNTSYSADRLYAANQTIVGAPTPISPANGGTVLFTTVGRATVVFRWAACQAADGDPVRYEIQYALNGGNYSSASALTTSTYTRTFNVNNSTVLSWKVRAYDLTHPTITTDFTTPAWTTGFLFQGASLEPAASAWLMASFAGEQDAAGQVAWLDAAPVHYSVNSDLMSLKVTAFDGSAVAVAPDAGWQSAASGTSGITPASPGAPVASGTVANAATADGVYWITDLATADRSWNYQLARFTVSAAVRTRARDLKLDFVGHGEPTAGYPTTLYLWNFRTSAWDQVKTGDAPVDVTWHGRVNAVGTAMCLGCHAAATPAGVVKPTTALDFTSTWGPSGDYHGAHAGTGFGGTLKEYDRGQAELSCAVCHDAHGNDNRYHINTAVNGTTGITVGTSGTTFTNLCNACHADSVATWHTQCATCHNSMSGGHYGDISQYTPTDSSDCSVCHGHARGFDHPDQNSCGGITNSIECHGVIPTNYPRAF